MSDEGSTKRAGGMKDRLRDELDKATGRDKGKDEPGADAGGPGGVKDNVQDEFDQAVGEDNERSSGRGGGPGSVKDNLRDEFDEASGRGRE